MIVAQIRGRWRRWWSVRHPRSDVHAMGQRNIYIVPSRPGLFFCLTVGVLLIASINDQLSLGYALTFLLAGAGLASMQATHANLRNLSLDLRPPNAVFAGNEVELEIRIHNPSNARYGIGLGLDGTETFSWADAPERGHAVVHVRYVAAQRGLRELPTLRIVTRFPLGLFRAWSYWRPASPVWVYPQPEHPAPAFAPQRAGLENERINAVAPPGNPPQGQDFEGVRPYRRGDSPRRVLWKKAALALEHDLPLTVRDTTAPATRQLWLDWSDTRGMADAEARLSRLSAWVLAAEQAQMAYGLQLPGVELAPDLGPAQSRQCLELLASFTP